MVVNALDDMISLLAENWDANNVDGSTPIISKIFEVKRIDLGNSDYVLIYEGRAVPKKNSIGTQTRKLECPISIDIRTMKSEDRLWKLFNEVNRIINSSIINPSENFDILEPDDGWINLSDKTIKLWRIVKDVRFVATNTLRR